MAVPPDDESCAQCRFYLDGASECHRHPPSVWLATAEYRMATQSAASRVAVTWPYVSADAWCGEFLKIKTATPITAGA